jgi:hypothetical protein
MGFTNYRELRGWMKTAIKGRAPTILPGLGRFTPWQAEGDDFARWAEGAALGCFRTFDIRHGFDIGFVPPHDLIGYFAEHTVAIEIAYPLAPALYGDEGQADLEDLIDADVYDVDKVVGQPSSNLGLWPSGLHGCRFAGSALADLPGVRLLRLSFALTYNRSIPT